MSAAFLSPIVRRGLVYSLRFELAFVLLCGSVTPLLALTFSEINRTDGFYKASLWLTQPSVFTSFVGSVLCAIASIVILRRLRYFPGVAVARSILPVVMLMFGLFIGLIAGLRLDYYNKLIFLCFLGTLLARFAITAMRCPPSAPMAQI